jgi:hypothetical protein
MRRLPSADYRVYLPDTDMLITGLMTAQIAYHAFMDTLPSLSLKYAMLQLQTVTHTLSDASFLSGKRFLCYYGEVCLELDEQ